MMVTNLRGELTIPHQNRIKDLEMFEAVARFLHLSSGEEMDEVKDVFFPSLVCSAVKVKSTSIPETFPYRFPIIQTINVSKLKSLQKYGADLSSADYDSRTPLHVAASDGLYNVVEFLLNNGALVHVRDRDDNTPLMSAVKGDHFEIVTRLINFLNQFPLPIRIESKLTFEPINALWFVFWSPDRAVCQVWRPFDRVAAGHRRNVVPRRRQREREAPDVAPESRCGFEPDWC